MKRPRSSDSTVSDHHARARYTSRAVYGAGYGRRLVVDLDHDHDLDLDHDHDPDPDLDHDLDLDHIVIGPPH
jgi:hypothetical protein